LNHLWAAPFQLQDQLLSMIDQVAKAAMQGVSGRIILKMNSLTDNRLAEALVVAGQSGVEIDLLVRGACIIPAQRSGFTERIRVRSIIGRFLEHSRIFYFRIGEKENLYLSSADWMNRNMLRRIELAWPVLDKDLRQRIKDECLSAYLHDTADAWSLNQQGVYDRIKPHGKQPALSAQRELMNLYSKK
jgi:polyphosphate kinase